MNRIRRKALEDILSKLEDVHAMLTDVQEAEEEARDNIPESLQESERYEHAEAACDALYEAVSNLEAAAESIQEAIDA